MDFTTGLLSIYYPAAVGRKSEAAQTVTPVPVILFIGNRHSCPSLAWWVRPLGGTVITSLVMLTYGLLSLYYPAEVGQKSAAAQTGCITTGVVSLVSGGYFFRSVFSLPFVLVGSLACSPCISPAEHHSTNTISSV
eukprot:1895982-Heterocapsa_arctica.AAC.1